jgi:hypothetical protein
VSVKRYDPEAPYGMSQTRTLVVYAQYIDLIEDLVEGAENEGGAVVMSGLAPLRKFIHTWDNARAC